MKKINLISGVSVIITILLKIFIEIPDFFYGSGVGCALSLAAIYMNKKSITNRYAAFMLGGYNE